MERLARLFPLAGRLRGATPAELRRDLIAGLTTAVMLIPQAMAYAMLAGLPPIVGLYAAAFPLVAYSLLGTSRELAVGPVAMVSLMVAASVAPIAGGDPIAYAKYAVLLAAMVGIFQLVMGLVRGGFLVNFLSHPVVSGFTSAAALIIGFSQLKHLLGVPLPRSHHIHEIIGQAIAHAAEIQLPTLIVGVASVVGLIVLKRRFPKWPRALIVVGVATVAVWGLGLDARGVGIVGEVPPGLPPLQVPSFDAEIAMQMLPTAIAISLVGFMESISVAKAFASRTRAKVDANRELVALGAANVVAGLTAGYPVTGGFSRTAVNADAGARSGLAGLVTAAVVVLTLLLLTPLFYFLPKAVLAAVIMTAVFGLVDVHEVRRLWTVDRGDLGLLGLTFVSTLTLGIEAGIGVGVAASLLVFVVRTTRPHTAILGRLPGTDVFRNVANYPEAEPVPGILAVRIDAQFYFGNVTFLKEALGRALADDPEIRKVVIDASSINRLDSSADAALHEIAADLEGRDIALHFAGVKGPVWGTMQRSGFDRTLGPQRFHMTVAEALAGTEPVRDAAA